MSFSLYSSGTCSHHTIVLSSTRKDVQVISFRHHKNIEYISQFCLSIGKKEKDQGVCHHLVISLKYQLWELAFKFPRDYETYL